MQLVRQPPSPIVTPVVLCRERAKLLQELRVLVFGFLVFDLLIRILPCDQMDIRQILLTGKACI